MPNWKKPLLAGISTSRGAAIAYRNSKPYLNERGDFMSAMNVRSLPDLKRGTVSGFGRIGWHIAKQGLVSTGSALIIAGLWCSIASPATAQRKIDVQSYFKSARDAGRAGLARKTKLVDVRPARPGEVIVTVIKGEGKETQSPPAKKGDMVVRNRCPETGNEQILVPAAKFARRYEGPLAKAKSGEWRPYRPRGVRMRYTVVLKSDGRFTFTAPWGERMVARPGDAIVQDLKNPKDTYRIAKAAFECTYEILKQAE